MNKIPMNKTWLAAVALAGIAAFDAQAQGGPAPQTPAASTQQQIYGWQLMTPQEMQDYRARMRAAKTAAERNRIRAEHHQAMQERAKERGVTLPDMPMGRGMGGPGRGMRQGMGSGMGPGQGMGRGMGPAQGMGAGTNTPPPPAPNEGASQPPPQ